jgi:hypothetical protein
VLILELGEDVRPIASTKNSVGDSVVCILKQELVVHVSEFPKGRGQIDNEGEYPPFQKGASRSYASSERSLMQHSLVAMLNCRTFLSLRRILPVAEIT